MEGQSSSSYDPANSLGNSDLTHLTILHYNDVYNTDSNSITEPVGGAARFSTAMKSFKHLDPLILFSGDVFSPSMCKLSWKCAHLQIVVINMFFFPVSTFTKGEQMIPVLNTINTNCAVFGNHDFGKVSFITCL